MSWGAIVVGVIGAGVGLYQSSKNRELAEKQAEDVSTKQAEAQGQLEKEKAAYKNMKIKNMYADMENPYEDLTINQQQAQFQAQQMEAQRANIMRGLKGAAGASGIAGLAQAMANQGQLQAQQISGSIGQQEARNQMLAAQGAQQRQRGAAAVDLSIRGGDAMLQQAESGRQATLLGMAEGQAAGANVTYQQQLANQQAANQSANEMQTQALSGLFGSDEFKTAFSQ